MSTPKGQIVLMGSGELTATMVEVHKQQLARLSGAPRAVFLDTPAGFQLNADQISQNAAAYFRTRVGAEMAVASLKAADLPVFETEKALSTLRHADYVLIGPGSPTYAVRVLSDTPVPDILTRRVTEGACLVAASAAALTVGRFTLPVYEIYKVGEDPHWVDGMNLLSAFGFDLTVIPHWNNAEGGTHDTRCCFMGESRFRELESRLPSETAVLGLDEHTACRIDFAAGMAHVRGLGLVELRRGGSRWVFGKNESIPLDLLRGESSAAAAPAAPTVSPLEAPKAAPESETGFWASIHRQKTAFQGGLDAGDAQAAAAALLELDRLIWQAHQELESEEFIAQAREILRDLVVLLAQRLEAAPADRADCLKPLVEGLLQLRATFRENRQWASADAIRDTLNQSGIIVEDTTTGSHWHIVSSVG